MDRLIKEWLRFFIAFISLVNITDGKNEKYLRLGTSPQERSELPLTAEQILLFGDKRLLIDPIII